MTNDIACDDEYDGSGKKAWRAVRNYNLYIYRVLQNIINDKEILRMSIRNEALSREIIIYDILRRWNIKKHLHSETLIVSIGWKSS